MSLNKTRKRLIRKYRKLFNSYPIGIKISTDGGNTFSAMGRVFETFIPDASVVKSGNINASDFTQGSDSSTILSSVCSIDPFNPSIKTCLLYFMV